eukprot:8021055-Pyramimonas_sp.AAC.1
MQSVHCPTWEERRAEADAAHGAAGLRRLSIYLFGFDAGPENARATKYVCDYLSCCPDIATMVSRCLLHQMHLIVRQVLDFIDFFEWDDFWESEPELDCWNALPAYSTTVSGVSSAWRCPGSARKLREAGSTIGSVVWSNIGGSIPGRVLRGRWGSIDSVEGILVNGGCLLADVFRRAFDTNANRADAGEDLGADAGNKDAPGFWRVMGAKYKMNSVNALGSDIFQITCLISFKAKSPLLHFLCWAQERGKSYKQTLKHDDSTYGKTPMSELVCEMVDIIASDFGKLLSDDCTEFAAAFRHAGGRERHRQGVRQLVVASVALAAAGWDVRVHQDRGW